MKAMIGFVRALSLTREWIPVLGSERVDLVDLVGRVPAEPILAQVDSPGLDVSRKDGYAVLGADLAGADQAHPVRLQVIGEINAGGDCSLELRSGQALRITTGAPIPAGADAVVAEEYVERKGQSIDCRADANPGRNVLSRGTDLAAGQAIVQPDECFTPARVGLLAAAGLADAKVYRLPRVGVIATGDEVVAPGQSLGQSKLYASNMVELAAWLGALGMRVHASIVPDQASAIRDQFERESERCDAILTSGGAWTSEKDLLVRVLDDLGWQGIYHRVRLGPGKGVAFGLLAGKPVFCLPGGPPSCEMAFMQLALPGLLQMAGRRHAAFPELNAILSQPIHGQSDWTQFFHARLLERDGNLVAEPTRQASRLRSMADKQALIVLPEGVEDLRLGDRVRVQVLAMDCLSGCLPLRGQSDLIT